MEERSGSVLEDNQVNIDRRINLEFGQILHDGGGAVDVHHSLVDSHLVSVPGVGSLSAGRFSASNSQDLGRDSDWAPRLVTLVLSSSDDLVASELKRLDVSTLEGDPTQK